MPHHTLMFGWEYPPRHLGGLGVACQGLVRGLLHHGTKVTLVLPDAEADSEPGMKILSPGEDLLKTIRVRSALQPYSQTADFVNKSEHTSANRGIPLYDNDLGGAVHEFTECSVEMTKGTNPDIVHSHDWMTFEAGKRAAAHHHVPFVAQVHATELDRTHFKPNQWIYDRERSGLNAANHIITVSRYTKNMLVKEYGIRPDKITVVHNGINPTARPGAAAGPVDPPLILFLGRLTVQKGPFHFLEAARIVHEYNKNARFIIAGEGYLLGELIDKACEIGMQDYVIFAGKVSCEEAKELYRQASCFVMPSTSEPFGLVALEAAAYDTPVIVSRQSGVSEVLPHSFHVDFWDINKLADCILTILRDKPLADQLRLESMSAIGRLSWNNQASKVLSVYDKARIWF